MKKAGLLAALAVITAILLHPEAAVNGAHRAMALWYSGVAPSLFPFLVLMPLITGPEACAAYEAAFGKIMGAMFRLPGSAAPALIIGMIAGSPGGAIAVNRVAVQSGMKKSDAARLGMAVAGISPAYLIMGVGHALFGSAKLGLQLAAVQACIQLILLATLRLPQDDETVNSADVLQKRNPVASAVESILAVCGYMVFCATVAGALADVVGPGAGYVLLAIADLPMGLSLIGEGLIPGGLVVTAAAIGFGGLCIAFQNLDVLRSTGVRTRDFIALRCICAAMFACAAFIMEGNGQTIASGLPASVKIYAFSLLCACISAIPVLNYLSNNTFLNKRNFCRNGCDKH